MNNREWLSDLEDDELALLLAKITADCTVCPVRSEWCGRFGQEFCRDTIERWLKSEHDSETCRSEA